MNITNLKTRFDKLFKGQLRLPMNHRNYIKKAINIQHIAERPSSCTLAESASSSSKDGTHIFLAVTYQIDKRHSGWEGNT